MGKPLEYNFILKYSTKAALKEPLHVGSSMGDKNEVLIHPVTGIPFIQASSIAGAMRAYCDEAFSEKTEYRAPERNGTTKTVLPNLNRLKTMSGSSVKI